MNYFHWLISNYRKLRNRKQGKYRKLFILELATKNRTNIKTVLFLLAFIFFFSILFIDLPRYLNGALFQSTAYRWIFIGRISVFLFSVLVLSLSFIIKPSITIRSMYSVRAVQRTIISLVTLGLLTNAVGDFLLSGNIETYIGVFLALGILIQMTDFFSFLFFFLGFLLFNTILLFLSPGHSFIPVFQFLNCFSFSLLSFMASRITFYAELNRFHQKMIIVEQKEKLEELSTIDQLTKTYNRRKFDELISGEIERANRYKHNFSVIMFDVDHFKQVNDRYGHQVGDKVLVEISSLVKRNLRKTDSIIRWGGEEFVVIAAETILPNAGILGEKLRELIHSHIFPGPGHITSSFGITDYIKGETADTLMKRVDKALYAAKENGRNRTEVI